MQRFVASGKRGPHVYRARLCSGYASAGQKYTRAQFLQYYGDERGEYMWENAAQAEPEQPVPKLVLKASVSFGRPPTERHTHWAGPLEQAERSPADLDRRTAFCSSRLCPGFGADPQARKSISAISKAVGGQLQPLARWKNRAVKRKLSRNTSFSQVPPPLPPAHIAPPHRHSVPTHHTCVDTPQRAGPLSHRGARCGVRSVACVADSPPETCACLRLHL